MRFQTLAEWLAWQETLHPKAIDLGLHRVAGVLQGLRLPDAAPLTLTVGGTNGKGSCVAMLDQILRCAGYRVGTYTSPHILRYNERIRIDGQEVADERIIDAFARIDAVRGETTLSFFEFGTLAALEIFAHEALDVRILEVGLGGRLDAVNVVDADVALLASIDLDHTEWLGNSREAIGLEKAGIFRSGRAAVIGDPDVPKSVRDFAAEWGVPLYRQGFDFRFEDHGPSWSWFGSGGRQWRQLPLPAIPGRHQLLNAAAVLQVLDNLRERLEVPEAAVREGLRSVRLPGRFQTFPGPVTILLDVAHNPQAVSILADHVRDHYPRQRVHAVFAVMRDKDIPAIVARMAGLVHHWYLAPLRIGRAASPQELLPVFDRLSVNAVSVGFGDAAAAFAEAKRQALPGELIVVFGSFFLVSEFLARAADPEEPTNG